MDKNPQPSDVQSKVLRLFTYLEKALVLDDTVIRDFRETSAQPSPWWLADLPTDVDNLYVRPFETEITIEDPNNLSSAWIRVEKKDIKSAPDLPESLVEWMNDINPLEAPKAKEKIDREVRFKANEELVSAFRDFEKDFKQGDKPSKILEEWVVLSPDKAPQIIEQRYVEDSWKDHPELQSLLEDYIDNEWVSWAEKVKKVYSANLLYDQLYALRLLLKNEGDSYELLLGQGLVTWKGNANDSVFAPIFLTPLVLDFDPAKRVIEISPDPLFRGFSEISALYGLDNPAEIDLITWSDKINSNPFDFWHLESLKTQCQILANYIATDSEDHFTSEIVASPEITKKPSIWNAPVIFARKRTNDLWSKYAGFIRRDIEQNEVQLTEFISDLVGDYEEKKSDVEADETSNADANIQEGELFFPLPWNNEQKRIAERLESNYGVVVKGPPGTGKSHTIANLISRFLAQGKTVLVTSQTSKALDVLRDKLPENIRSLAVSQLNQSAKKDDVLQQSISEISSNLGERHTKYSEDKADTIRKELQSVREQKAELANKIRKYILTDSTARLEIGGEVIKPVDAAKLVDKFENSSELGWFTDEVNFTTELTFKAEDLNKYHSLLLETTKSERGLYDYELPELSILPHEEMVFGAFASYKEHASKAKASDKYFGKCDKQLKQGELSEISTILLDAKKVLDSRNKDYELEIFNLCSVSQSERTKWKTVLNKISERLEVIGASDNAILGHDITGNPPLALNELIDAVNILKAKVKGGLKIGTFTKILLPSNARKVMEMYKIDGYIPNTEDRIELLRQSLIAQNAKQEIQTLLAQSFTQLKSSLDISKDYVDTVQLEVLVSGIKRFVNYTTDFAKLDTFCKKIKGLSHLSYTKSEDIDELQSVVSSKIACYEVESLDELFQRWIVGVNSSVNGDHYPVVEELLDAIQKKNSAGWKNTLTKLNLLFNQKKKATWIYNFEQLIKPIAPNLCSDIVGLADQSETFECPHNLELAWKVSRLKSWLDTVHDNVDIDDLQHELDRLTKKEQQLNSELVTILAWQRQIDKVTKQQRDALMAWSLSMKKFGKGTGKYANTHLRSAQEALKEAKHAVPVWIMPLHRVAQMFPEPKSGMFDVVIFDEASQCDIKGLTIGYLGKKLLVVGDPEQISPAGSFQNQEKIFELISRYLFDIPFKETFSITSSLFDLAKIRLSNIIQLNEHFRCVPEIIAFSNHHIYEGKLKPLRYPNPNGLLKPALVPVFVENGYQNTNNKVNEPEAEQIVKKLVELLNDPAYQTRPDGRLCTFGIISLLAVDQAKHIEKLIRELVTKGEISEKTIEERKIECGDAYKFQGDERDVMLLSMVGALDSNDPTKTIGASGYTDDRVKQRFNVAASRARDQMFLFHSIPLDSLGNKSDWRYKLLSWFYDPKKEEVKAGREILKKEFDSGRASQFSYDVGNLMIDRGYQVLPEYPVIGYRIDLVVQGADARLAVECDGDQYHTLENWDEDQVRENQLRRAGWEFWRISGSSFYRYKEKALDSLWKKLDEMGIKPIIGQ